MPPPRSRITSDWKGGPYNVGCHVKSVDTEVGLRVDPTLTQSRIEARVSFV